MSYSLFRMEKKTFTSRIQLITPIDKNDGGLGEIEDESFI